MKVFQVIRDVVHIQGKNCWVLIHIGCTVFILRRLWGQRKLPFIWAEIDTPLERLNINFIAMRDRGEAGQCYGVRLKPNQKPGNSYRDRWLRKLNLA